MYLSDRDRVLQAFHPSAKITGYMGGDLLEQPEEFANFVGAQTPSVKDRGEAPMLETLSVDITGEPVAKVRDGYLGIFIDTLSMLKIDESWVIYNKFCRRLTPSATPNSMKRRLVTQQNHMWHSQRSQRYKGVSKGRLIEGFKCNCRIRCTHPHCSRNSAHHDQTKH